MISILLRHITDSEYLTHNPLIERNIIILRGLSVWRSVLVFCAQWWLLFPLLPSKFRPVGSSSFFSCYVNIFWTPPLCTLAVYTQISAHPSLWQCSLSWVRKSINDNMVLYKLYTKNADSEYNSSRMQSQKQWWSYIYLLVNCFEMSSVLREKRSLDNQSMVHSWYWKECAALIYIRWLPEVRGAPSQ